MDDDDDGQDDCEDLDCYGLHESCPEEDCDDVFMSVCSKDGQVFHNYCAFREYTCKEDNKDTELDSTGSCDNLTLDHEGCENVICPELKRPICASNGKTYQNLCFMYKDKCATEEDIIFDKLGPCQEEDHTVDDCPRFCPAVFAPVCGSDGVTYSNECQLTTQACVSKTDLTLSHPGPCTDDDVETDDEEEEEDQPKPGCPKFCPEFLDPICGSDGVTYDNPCFLARESCQEKKVIVAVSRGPCPFGEDPLGPPCPNLCPLIYRPVCGSDGNTYDNASF